MFFLLLIFFLDFSLSEILNKLFIKLVLIVEIVFNCKEFLLTWGMLFLVFSLCVIHLFQTSHRSHVSFGSDNWSKLSMVINSLSWGFNYSRIIFKSWIFHLSWIGTQTLSDCYSLKYKMNKYWWLLFNKKVRNSWTRRVYLLDWINLEINYFVV